MNRPATLAVAAAALLCAFAFAQENERKPEEKKPASKGKPSKPGPQQPGSRGPSQPTARPNAERPPAERQNVEQGRGRGPSVQTNRENPAGRGPVAARPAARPLPQGSRVVQTRGGGQVTMRSNGRPAVVRAANGIEVRHALTGRTVVVHETVDHTRVVAMRGGFGYVQHPYVYGGHPYLARTYIVAGRPYEAFYRGYPFHGAYLEVYAPVHFYPVAFYGWAYNPWVVPIRYNWGWGVGTPWFGFYGGFFTPYPVYASASLWLTDYMIAESLNAAYQAQMAAQAANYPPPAPPPPGGPVALTPEVKQAIADEVQRQLSQENAEAQANARSAEPDPATTSIAAELSDNQPHVFVVGDGLDLVNAAGQECAVTEGDVLQLAGPPAPDASSATLIVLAGKGGLECRKGSSVTVAFTDLQDMQNHMRRTLDAGLADLQAHQNGLPAPPPAAAAAATPAVFTMGAPPPDPTAASQVDAQLQQGTQAEQQTMNDYGSAPPPTQAAPPQAAPGAQPATISLGQTIDQVTAILGQPSQVVDLGAKKIYVYPSLKITFSNGQVADVQ